MAAGSAVTVREVAVRANVSKATAARVLGGYGPVSDVVREAVLTAAHELGYRTNRLARSMATGRTGTIGAILGDVENPFFGRVARGITDAASAAGLDVIIANTDENLDTERGLVDVLVGKRVDGLIVSAASSVDIRHLQDTGTVPVVLIDRLPEQPELFDAVYADNRGGGELLGRAVQAAGHRRIAFLTSLVQPGWAPGVPMTVSSVAHRVDGLQTGLGAHAEMTVHLDAQNVMDVAAIIDELLASDDPPTAFVASDSKIALHAFNVFSERGLQVGSDVSLCTFDNADWTTVTVPGVTVVEQPMYEIGRQGAELLLRRIEGDADETRSVELAIRLIERGSIARVGA